MYAVLRNEAKPKKNLILGVTLPYVARQSPEVAAEAARFRRELLWTCVALFAVALPCMLIRDFGVMMFVWLLWLVMACIVAYVPFIRANRRLHRLKVSRGWGQSQAAVVVTDLKNAAITQKWVSPVWFLLPTALGLAPLLWDRTLWPLLAMNAALCLFCWAGYRWLYRNRAEVVDGDSSRTGVLTRIRRYNWAKEWLIVAWSTAVLSIALSMSMGRFWAEMAAGLIYGVVLVASALGIEFRVRHAQEKWTAGSGQADFVDDDAHWIWGIFYYNPHDSRLVVNARTGLNSTFNLARRSGQAIGILLAFILLAMPLVGVWLIHEERQPVHVEVTETAVVANHSASAYAVPLTEIAQMELLETLPSMTRVSGTNMDSVLNGRYAADAYGRITVCLDPRTGPYLLITTTDGTKYLFGCSDGTAAEVVAALE